MTNLTGLALFIFIVLAVLLLFAVLVTDFKVKLVSVTVPLQAPKPKSINWFAWGWPWLLPVAAILLLVEAALFASQYRNLGMWEWGDVIGRIVAVFIAFIPAVQLRNRLVGKPAASFGEQWLRVFAIGLAVYFVIRAAGAITGLLPRVT